MLHFLSFKSLYFENDSIVYKNLTLIKVVLGGFVIFHNLVYSINNACVTLLLIIYYLYLSINYCYALFLEKKIKNIKFHLILFLFFLFISCQYRVIGFIDPLFILVYVSQGSIVFYSFFLKISDNYCPSKPKSVTTINSETINNFFKIEWIKKFVITFLKFYNSIILLTYYIVSILVFCFPSGIHLFVISSGIFLLIERAFTFLNSKSILFNEIYCESRVCCTNREHIIYPILKFCLVWEGLDRCKDGLFLGTIYFTDDPEKVASYERMYISGKETLSNTPFRWGMDTINNQINSRLKTSNFTGYENFKKKD